MSTKGIKLSIDTIGDKRTRKKLQDLSFKSIRKINRQAVRKAITPVTKALRQEVPVDEKDLKKSQTSKVFGSGLNVGGVAGADAAYRRTNEDGEVKVPSNYDHLVNNGHINADGSFTPPDGYRDRAAASSLPQAERVYTDHFVNSLEKEATK